MPEIDNMQDVIDVRDVIAQFENLVASIEYCEENSEVDANEQAERDSLKELLDELRGNGGDEQWQGDWYPVTLIRDSHFESYAMEYADDLGGSEMQTNDWPFNCIDWTRAARELQIDYTSVEYNGITYWYR